MDRVTADCVTCGRRFFRGVQESWKTLCLDCYLEKNGVPPRNKRPQAPKTTISKSTIPGDMLRRLLQLCHPDKHSNSKLSVETTQWLLQRKQEQEKRQ